MAYTLNNLSDWKQKFLTSSVQNNKGTFGADFLSSESTVMFSGPAEYTSTATDLVPIGFVQNVQLSQQKQIQQLFEIGSRKPFFIPGRTIVSGGMSRILFDGPSLMYSMYLRTPNPTDGSKALINPKGDSWKPTNILGMQDFPTNMNDAAVLGGDEQVAFKASSADNPKPGYFFINLASSFFNIPTGLGFILYDMEDQPYGGFYLENCFIQAHTFSLASQQTVLVENVSFRASSVSAIDLDVIPTSTKPES